MLEVHFLQIQQDSCYYRRRSGQVEDCEQFVPHKLESRQGQGYGIHLEFRESQELEEGKQVTDDFDNQPISVDDQVLKRYGGHCRLYLYEEEVRVEVEIPSSFDRYLNSLELAAVDQCNEEVGKDLVRKRMKKRMMMLEKLVDLKGHPRS